MTQDSYVKGIKRIIINEDEIRMKISEAGKYIDSLYDGKPILLVGILKGCFMFLADLARAVSVPCEVAFMAAQSYYGGADSSGSVDINMDLKQDISGYHVIIAEDIIDTGRTLSEIFRRLKEHDPLSLRVITLLDKPERRAVDFKADISLFTIEDVFVVGYGLDCGEYYRNLPYIAEFNTETINQD